MSEFNHVITVVGVVTWSVAVVGHYKTVSSLFWSCVSGSNKDFSLCFFFLFAFFLLKKYQMWYFFHKVLINEGHFCVLWTGRISSFCVVSTFGWQAIYIKIRSNSTHTDHHRWTPFYFMYDPKCSTTFPWCTLNTSAVFASVTYNVRTTSYIKWTFRTQGNGVHILWCGHGMETIAASLVICEGTPSVITGVTLQRTSEA